MALTDIAQIRVSGLGDLVVLELLDAAGQIVTTTTFARHIAIQIGQSMIFHAYATDVLDALLENTKPPPAQP